MPNISFRHVTINELSRIMLITKLAYQAPHKENSVITKPHEPENTREMFLSKKFFVLAAVCDDKIIGAVRYEIRENNSLYFFKLAVLKAYRKQHIGSALVKNIEHIAKRKQCAKIQLDCLKEKQLDGFYKRLGFKVDTMKRHKEYHKIYMSKKI